MLRAPQRSKKEGKGKQKESKGKKKETRREKKNEKEEGRGEEAKREVKTLSFGSFPIRLRGLGGREHTFFFDHLKCALISCDFEKMYI